MPNLSEIVVDIRARINYESFFRAFLPEMRRQGREYVARCPFHDDTTPSLSINTDAGLWVCRVPNCRGHEGGDFIDFVRAINNWTFQEAVEYAAAQAGAPINESRTARNARIAFENSHVDEDALVEQWRIQYEEGSSNGNPIETRYIDSAIVRAFHDQLRDGERRTELLNWLFNERGIRLETVDAYDIGHNGARYTIPIYDLDGRIVNIRQYLPNAQNGQKMISWREGFGSARLYPIAALCGHEGDTVYIMEGEWDCLLARQNGLNAITSTAGASAWNEEWNEQFRNYNVAICYDNDDAGRFGAMQVAVQLASAGATVRVLADWEDLTGTTLPSGFDFTDYILGGYSVERLKYYVATLPPFVSTPPEPPSPPEPTPVCHDDPDAINRRTDVGNARRLANRHGGDVKYVSRTWYAWDGTRYALDETGEIERRAKETVRAMFREADSLDDDARRKMQAFSLASESASRIRAMIDLSKSESTIAMPASAMDANAWLLNCTNGTYDFNLHDTREHRHEDFITMSTRQPYDPAETSPRWIEFIRRTFDNNDDVIAFVQRAVGYSLIGVTTEQVLFFCYGTGANGKSTFLETIRDVCGDYARNADFSTFATQRGGHSGPRNDIMRLRNARFVTAIEFDAGRALDEIVIKQLTGGDTISARRLYSESEEFRPTFTPWIAGNHKPIIKGTDEAIWRRLRLIPFTVTIPPGERNPNLRQRLLEEAPGILRWAIDGAEWWMRVGLQPPREVLVATQSYRNEMDTVEPFLESRCIREDRASVKSSELFATYRQWATDSGEEPISKVAFGLRMSEKGFESVKRSGGVQYRVGLRLRNVDDLIDQQWTPANENGSSPEDAARGDIVPFESRGPDW